MGCQFHQVSTIGHHIPLNDVVSRPSLSQAIPSSRFLLRTNHLLQFYKHYVVVRVAAIKSCIASFKLAYYITAIACPIVNTFGVTRYVG